jgi:hypothetical protein
VLVGDDGTVLLAGFVGPDGSSSELGPQGEGTEAALVWRLGALLAALLTGRGLEEPGQARAVLESLGSAGAVGPRPVVPEPVVACLTAMLAPEPASRPELGSLPVLLREAATVDLGHWAGDFLPAVRRRLEAEWEIPAQDRVNTLLPGDSDEITEESDLSLVFLSDPLEEVTAASGGRAGWPRELPEHGAIPVGVGPPAEAVTGPHRLPAELFDEDPVTAQFQRPAGWRGALWASAVLAIVALVLGAYVVAG